MDAPEPRLPEYRRDPLTGDWVLIAPERAHRPIDPVVATRSESTEADCPFCPGNESATPTSVLSLSDDSRNTGDTGDWSVRVFANRYPAARPAPDFAWWQAPADAVGGLADIKPGIGRHEVVVESRQHRPSWTSESDAHAGLIFEAYRQRMQALTAAPEVAYCHVFKNAGSAAGASQHHAHAQILAVAHTPPLVLAELSGGRRYHNHTARCYFCDLLSQERSGPRLVAETSGFVALCPFASRFPGEIWVLPRVHRSRFAEAETETMTELGGLVRRLLAGLEAWIGGVSYNYYLHSAPLAAGDADRIDAAYHWHLEILPRIVGLAGFELGAGMYLNPFPPEWCAQRFREWLAHP